jgi:hypothetical protein
VNDVWQIDGASLRIENDKWRLIITATPRPWWWVRFWTWFLLGWRWRRVR